MATCAAASARSPAAWASSSAVSSGSSAPSASSVTMTAWSLSCSANNVSSSGCTSPPRSDLVARIPLAELVEHAALLRDQGHLSFGTLERESAVELLQRPLQPARLDPVHRPLVQLVGIALPQPFRLEQLVGARGRLVQREHRIVGDGFEHAAVGGKLEFFGVDGFDDTTLPRLAVQHQEQEGLLGAGGE